MDMPLEGIAWLIWVILLGVVGLVADGLTILAAWRSLRQSSQPGKDSEPPMV